MEQGKTYILRRQKKGKNAEDQADTVSINGYRVGVYARVSTDHEDQKTSFENQIKELDDKIQYLPPELRKTEKVAEVVFYADEGITGTHADIRPEFQRMVEDAKRGKIDIISVKNISRFARSLRDAIQYITQLTEAKIAVYFREEGLYNFGENFNLMFSLLSSIAEQESINTSSHVMATLTRYMETGVKVNASTPFGYDCIDRPELPQKRVLVPNADAGIVRKIFRWYLDGYTTTQISKMLKDQFGIEKRATTIASLLHNPSYAGILVQRKSYTDGVRGKRIYTDEGIVSPYRHEAIISEEDFYRVQDILFERAHLVGKRKGAVPLTGLIHCGRCGSTFVRHADRDQTAWACSSYQKGIHCKGRSIKTIHDSTIKRLYVNAVKIIKSDSRRYGVNHYTDDQIQALEDMTTNAEDIRKFIDKIVIGNYDTEFIVKFEFTCEVFVEFETISTDIRYKRELTIRVWAQK